jgi:hypothetical protein
MIANKSRSSITTLCEVLALTSVSRICQFISGIVFLAAASSCLHAQGLFMPSAGWGAPQIPSPSGRCDIAVSTDLFTDMTKPVDRANGRYATYGADSTVGYNLGALGCDLSVFDIYPWRQSAVTVRITAGIGFVNDNVTNYLQNSFIHTDNDLEPIPRSNIARGRPIYVAEARVDRWFDQVAISRNGFRLRGAAFLGANGSLFGPFRALNVEAGYRMTALEISGMRLPTVSFMASKGVILSGDASWTKPLLANTFSFRQILVRVPLNEWFSRAAVFPVVTVGSTTSAGLFRDAGTPYPRRDAPPSDTTRRLIAEHLCSIGLSWVDARFAIDTYNDSCGDKDQGPTFGLRVTFSVRSR